MGRTREFRLWGALRNNRQKLKGATRGAMQSWFPKDIPDRVHRPAKPRRTILSETFCHVYLDPTKLGSPQNVFFTFYELVNLFVMFISIQPTWGVLVMFFFSLSMS